MLGRRAAKPPDLSAVAKWLEDDASAGGAAAGTEGGLNDDSQGDEVLAGVGGVKQKVQQGLGPRIVANPVLQSQQLAGWLRLGPDGVTVEAGLGGQHAAAGAGDQQGSGGGGVGGVGTTADGLMGGNEAMDMPGGVADEQQQQQAVEEDLMDEEDWV